MIPADERDDLDPVCPHCGAVISRLGFRQVQTIFGKRFIYFCLACRACLGISHRKGFWMG
ncbi:MAG: hypothetical protein P8Z74_16875 [Acidobacteriota bacterium]|jgi:hypothetical protein